MLEIFKCFNVNFSLLTLILLTWRIWWAPNNASKWQIGFNSAFQGLKTIYVHLLVSYLNRTLHVADTFSVHHQEFFTLHTAIGIWHTGFADCFRVRSGWNGSYILILCVKYLLLCVQWKTPNDGHRKCPKHVESYLSNTPTNAHI